jgi:hypothetical protein
MRTKKLNSGVVSNGMMFICSFLKIHPLVTKLLGYGVRVAGKMDRHTFM